MTNSKISKTITTTIAMPSKVFTVWVGMGMTSGGDGAALRKR
jgi:hypothetical protein